MILEVIFFFVYLAKTDFFAVVFHCFLGGDSWLQQCHVSVCPTGELIALANGKRLIVLSAKWDSTSGLSQFQISYAGMPDENDVIKAVICLPIVGQSQSSHVSFYGLDQKSVIKRIISTLIKFFYDTLPH